MTIDRGGVYPINYRAHEKTMLIVQSKYDRQKIPQRWFWRLKNEKSDLDDEYFEETLIERSFADVVGVHLYIDDSAEAKGHKRGVVQTEGDITFEMSRAEARRLGVVFEKSLDKELLFDQEQVGSVWDPQDPIYFPQPGDLFFFRGQHYQVHQTNDDLALGPTDIPAVYKGTASLLKNDSTFPVELRKKLVPPSLTPQDRHPRSEAVVYRG